MEKTQAIEYYDRKTGKLCREKVMGDRFVRWAYQTMAGKALSPFIFGNSLLSRLLGWYFDSALSTGRIAETIDDLGIDSSEFSDPVDSFGSFNAFFSRHLQPETRPFSSDTNSIACPAEGRVLVHEHAIASAHIKIKGCNTTLADLFQRNMSEFDGGPVVVIRLCPADYHRFHFPCDGSILENTAISGKYHSVNPVALESVDNVFGRNKREYTLLDTTFGKIAMMEVGAFGVAGIVQTHGQEAFSKMAEKGYFKFGGSTVLLLFEPGKVKLADDLLEHSADGYETLVKVGETIAYWQSA